MASIMSAAASASVVTNFSARPSRQPTARSASQERVVVNLPNLWAPVERDPHRR
jgi:hypothetical protein